MATQQYRFSNGTVPNNPLRDPGIITRLPVAYKYVNGKSVKAYDDQFDTVIEDNKLPNGGNSMSTLPTGQTFNRVEALTERGVSGYNETIKKLNNEINELTSLLNNSKLDPQTLAKLKVELKRILKILNNMRVPPLTSGGGSFFSVTNPSNCPCSDIASTNCSCNNEVVSPSSICIITEACNFSPTEFGNFSDDGWNEFFYLISSDKNSPFYQVDNKGLPFYGSCFKMYNPDDPTSRATQPKIVRFSSWWDAKKQQGRPATFKICYDKALQPFCYKGTYTDKQPVEPVPGYITMIPQKFPVTLGGCFSSDDSKLNYYDSCNNTSPKFSTCFNWCNHGTIPYPHGNKPPPCKKGKCPP